MKKDGPDCAVSDNILVACNDKGKNVHVNLERLNAVDLQNSTSPKVVQNI